MISAAFLLRRSWLREIEHRAEHGPHATYKDKAGKQVPIRPRLFGLLPLETKKARFVTVDGMIALRLMGMCVCTWLLLVLF